MLSQLNKIYLNFIAYTDMVSVVLYFKNHVNIE